MSLDDLDLEFEDEEEAKKKKNEAVQVDVDLEFQSPTGIDKPRAIPTRPAPPPTSAANRPQTMRPPASNVQKIDEARPLGQIRRPPAVPPATASATTGGAVSAGPRVVGSNALQENTFDDMEAAEVIALRAQMEKTQFDAEVKVAVAEFKTELLSELNGDMKLMEHQIGQLLVRINAKHPDMKQEVLMIKKILADFTSKKRK